MSKEAVDFYFEFSSPYGYIASELAEEVEKRIGRPMRWRPILLGPMFKATGQAPLTEIPLKGEYAKRDFLRSAKFHGVQYRHPPKFPIGTVAALRAFYWVHDQDPAQARRLAKAFYRTYFVDNRDLSDPAVVVEIAGREGVNAPLLETALQDPAVKERAKREVDMALANNVFGSPFFIVDGEPFWGNDRLPMLEEWIRRGGW
jgi:2-hydroxychromene-2-carboxylate isomerase